MKKSELRAIINEEIRAALTERYSQDQLDEILGLTKVKETVKFVEDYKAKSNEADKKAFFMDMVKANHLKKSNPKAMALFAQQVEKMPIASLDKKVEGFNLRDNLTDNIEKLTGVSMSVGGYGKGGVGI